MGSKMWSLFALLLVSVGASRYDQGPHKFYDVSYDSIASEQNENKEVILYLTPDQVKTLEADGAVVRSAEEPENEEADSELPVEPQENDDQEEVPEQEETEDAPQEKEAQEEEQDNPEDVQDQDIDFEEILRILNEEQAEEEAAEEATEEQALNEPEIEEENTESPRNFSPRITLRQQQQQQQQEKYLAPAVAKKEQILKSYTLIRYQPNEQSQRLNIQLLQQRQEEADEPEEANEEPQTEAPLQGKRKYKLIPYEVVESQEQEQNAEAPAQVNSEAREEAAANAQNKNKLQAILRELKAASKYNDQKYAIEIERLKARLEKQKAETIAKTVPALIKQQVNKKSSQTKSKQGKGAEQAKPQQLKAQKSAASLANARPIPVPVIKSEKQVQRPIPVPVETSNLVSVKNVYVRTRTDKPFTITRKVPENKRQNPVEVPTSKPERITILRHIWEH